jgi:predicted RNA-binding protein with EMAP domain
VATVGTVTSDQTHPEKQNNLVFPAQTLPALSIVTSLGKLKLGNQVVVAL